MKIIFDIDEKDTIFRRILSWPFFRRKNIKSQSKNALSMLFIYKAEVKYQNIISEFLSLELMFQSFYHKKNLTKYEKFFCRPSLKNSSTGTGLRLPFTITGSISA